VIVIVILTKLMDFVVLAELTIVAIFPNVATAAIEERVVTPAIRELDPDVLSVGHGGLGLKEWLQYDHREKQSDNCEDRLRVTVNAHANASWFPQIAGLLKFNILSPIAPDCCRPESGLAVKVNPLSVPNPAQP
jgi:hypothetical protein